MENMNGYGEKHQKNIPGPLDLSKIDVGNQRKFDIGKVKGYSRRIAVALGIIHVVCSLISVALGILALILEYEFHENGFVILSGLLFLLPGIFGVISKNQMRFMILGFLVTSIVALVLASDIVVILAIALGNRDEIPTTTSNSHHEIVNMVGILLALVEMLTALSSTILCLLTFCQFNSWTSECTECRARRESMLMGPSTGPSTGRSAGHFPGLGMDLSPGPVSLSPKAGPSMIGISNPAFVNQGDMPPTGCEQSDGVLYL